MKHTHKKLAILIALGALSPLFALTAGADTMTTGGIEVKATAPINIKIRDDREALRNDVKQKHEEVRSEIKDLRASTTKEIKDKREEMKSDIQNKRAEFRGEELNNRVTNVSRMLEATATRLDGIVSRVESRTAKVKAGGADTTLVEASLTSVKADLVTARTHISNLAGIDLSGSSTTVKTNLELAKTETKATKDIFDAVRKSLEKIVSDLKDLGQAHKVSDEPVTATQ